MGNLKMSQFDNVSVVKQANVYFDGKCVSHTVQFADGSKKTLGVILPSSLTFNTGAPEVMECVSGSCRVLLKGETAWTTYGAGQSFKVPGNSSFEIACDEPYHYVCHVG
jgi:purine/pyrimidine-nucleoside phosphorylase